MRATKKYTKKTVGEEGANVLPYIWIDIKGIPYLLDFTLPTSQWMTLWGDSVKWEHIEIKT